MSRMLRAVRHLRQDATKFKFCLLLESLQIYREEPAEVIVVLSRGSRRLHGGSTCVQLSRGDNRVALNLPLEFSATLFKPKGAQQSGGLLRRSHHKQTAEEDADFLPKEAKLQIFETARPRRLPLRVTPRLVVTPSASSASVLPSDAAAAAAGGGAAGPPPTSPSLCVDAQKEAGALLAEATFDLATFVAAEAEGRTTASIPLDKTKGAFSVSFRCAKLDALAGTDEDCMSVMSAAISPSAVSLRLSPAPSNKASPNASSPGTQDPQPVVLRLPHKETLPSLLEIPLPEEPTPQQQQQQQQQQQEGEAAAAKVEATEASAAEVKQRPPELLSPETATTPTELSPAESQRQQQQQQQQQLLLQQQQQDELRRKDELIASLQRQVAFMEAEDRQAAAPQLAQLFQQIDELHTALAAAQEQQLAAAEQLQQQQERGNLSTEAAALQQQVQAGELRLQQQEQQIQELQQRTNEQQQQLLLLQAERDGIQLIADAYKKQVEELQQQQQRLQRLQQQPQQQLQEERVVLLLQQQEQQRQQLESKLAEETKQREAATNELRLLQQQLQQQQQQLLQQSEGTSDASAALRDQVVALQRQVAEAVEARESLRLAKEEEVKNLEEAMQALQHKYGEAQAAQQQTIQRLNTATEESAALRETIRCQEETLQRLPTQAAWSCAQQQHMLLLQQQREWQQQQQQLQRQQELEVAEKAKRIEELEKELVFAKVELAAAEQRRHEDIDAFKKKLEAVKDSVLAYAAASSSNLQPPAGYRAARYGGSGKSSPVKRLVPIGTLKAFFRPNNNSSSSNPGSLSNSPAAAPAAAAAAAAAAAEGDACTAAAATPTEQLNGNGGNVAQPPRLSSEAPAANNNSSSSNNNGSSSTSSSKSRPAAVSLFGNQGPRASPLGPSVTRFSAAKTGGCSLVTTTGA